MSPAAGRLAIDFDMTNVFPELDISPYMWNACLTPAVKVSDGYELDCG
jgi:hypothetical protein